MSEIREECGIILTHDFDDLYTGLKSLQNRGQETAGIARKTGPEIDIVKWEGEVGDFSDHYLGHLLNVNEKPNSIFIGHVRYSTSGKKDDVRNAHPHFIGGEVTHNRDHMIIRGAKLAAVHNGTLVGDEFESSEDCDTLSLLKLYEEVGPDGIIERIPAAYSAIIMDSDKDGVSVLRDRHGMRPLAIGEKKSKFIVASETRAINEIGGTEEGELRPGSIVYITPNPNGFRFQDVITGAPRRACFFEGNYLAHWKSSLDGQSVKAIRRRLGQQVAKEFAPGDITIVTYVPKAPYSVASGYGTQIGIQPQEIFYKKSLQRSFIEPDSSRRSKSINKNLFVRDDVDLNDQVIAILDDSIVRGNVIKDSIRKCKDRGASKVYFISVTPPLGPIIDGVPRGCLYGVDMPPEPLPEDNFIWRRFDGDLEKIKVYSGADAIHYISEAGMFAAYDMPSKNFCTYCIGGPDPLK